MDLLRHLAFFRAVADTRHFGDAARSLGMTQPPLSQGVQRLEASLGVRLFDRSARGVRITRAGQHLLPLARDLLSAADDLRAEAGSFASPEQVRIGIAADLEELSAQVFEALAHAGLSVSPRLAGSVDLVDLLHEGLLDAAVVRHPGVIDGLVAGPVHTLGLTLLGSARLRDSALPVVVPPRHHQPPAHDQFVDALRRLGHGGQVVEEPDAMLRRSLVSCGTAIGVRPTADAASAETPPLRVRVIIPMEAHRRPEVDHKRLTVLLEDTLPG